MDDSQTPAYMRRREALVVLFALVGGCSGGGDDAQATTDAEAPSPAPAPAPEPALPAPPPRRTWYIDPQSGRNEATGLSESSAKKSLPLLAAGDRVCLRRGTTLQMPGDYDPKVADVSFDAYALATDPADLPKPVWTLTSTTSYVVWTGNRDGLEFRNIRFEVPPGHTGRPAFRYTVLVPTTRALVLEDCDFVGDDGAFFADISTDCGGFTVRGCTFTCARAISPSFGATGCVFVIASSGRAPFQVTGMLWEGNRVTHPEGRGMAVYSGTPTDDNVTRFSGKFVDATFRRNRWHDCATSGVFIACGFHSDARIANAADHYGWDGILFEDNVVENNGGSGMSLGPNIRDTHRATTVQRNQVLNNGRRNGTTGGMQLNGLAGALVQDNICRDNWTTDVFDGVNLFMDIWASATDEMQTTGAVGCVLRRNVCSGARGAGGTAYAAWLASQRGVANSSNAPSSGIRLYFSHNNHVYANLLVDNGSGIACDKSADNQIFNNTAVACTMGFYDGVGMGTRGNRLFNNVSHRCDWDFYGLGMEGLDAAVPTTANVALGDVSGTDVRFVGTAQFLQVRPGVASRNSFIRERADADASRGLAVVIMKQNNDAVEVHVQRPFSALRFAPGELMVGVIEPYLSVGYRSNARSTARVGSLRAILPGTGDVLVDAQLDSLHRPTAGSPLVGAGVAVPEVPFGPVTDLLGRPFATRPCIGAFEAP